MLTGLVCLVAVAAGCSPGGSVPRADAQADVLIGHTGPVLQLTVLADGRLASAGEDGDIRVWGLDAGSEDLVIEAGLSKVAALDELTGGRLITAEHVGAEIWSLSDPTATPVLIPDSRNTYSVAVLSDGTVALGDANATVKIWDVDDLSQPVGVYQLHPTAGQFGALTRDVVELSSGLLASSASGVVHIWDRNELEVTVATSEGQHSGYFSLAELPDGRFVSTTTNGWVVLWGLDSPGSTESGYPEPGFYTGTDVLVLESGLVASRGSQVWVWSPSDPTTALATYERDQATAAVALPDGRLAIGYYDGQIHLWTPDTT